MLSLRNRVAPYWGSLTILVLSTLLILAAVRWMGYDLSLLSTAFITKNGDTYANSWAIYQAMDNLLKRPTNLGYSTIFYGETQSFAFTIAPYGICLAVLPLYLLSGGNLILTYNLYWLATFTLTAWAMYLLTRYLLHAPVSVALLVGLMVSFAQFRFLHTGHIESLSMQFYLLGLYCLHRAIDTPKPKWALALAASFWFTALTSAYLGVYLTISGGVILGYLFFWQRQAFSRRLTHTLLAAATIAILTTLPFLTMRFAHSPDYTYNDYVWFSAVPLDWFLGTSQIYTGVLPYRDEVTLFLGFTPIGLAAAAWFYRKRISAIEPADTQPSPWFRANALIAVYGFLVILGYLMTLGPVIRFTTEPVMPGPYLLFAQVPILGGLRVPARFIILSITGTGLMAGAFLTYIGRKTDRLTHQVLLGIIAVFLVVELTPNNGNGTKFLLIRTGASASGPLEAEVPGPIPPIYTWLKQQPPNTVVFHYPNGDANFEYLRYQPYHNQPMLNGYASLMPRWIWAFAWNAFPNADTLEFVIGRGTQYIIIHNDLLPTDAKNALQIRLIAPDVVAKIRLKEHVGDSDVYEVIR